ncbi:MAG: hypothetical protein CVU12_00680 [Bacteroidetes bacterium HGW-Bacteroidetes-7]|jgi:hypothetical protein|nr:MAG: hypothetical protein CVU12_00680 [Bacteroidetes bacterium HGW-Bacteroidetes-7]
MKDKRDIGEIVKSSLAEQEEGYVEGSWERFNLKQRRKRLLLIRNISAGVAAAVLLVLVVAALLYTPVGENLPATAQNEKTTNKSESVTVVSKPLHNETKLSENTDRTQDENNTGVKPVKSKTNLKASSDHSGVKSLISKSESTEVKKSVQNNEITDITVKEQIDSSLATTPPKTAEETQKHVPATVSSRTAFALSENERHDRKVRFGINVAPGMSSATDGSALNIGGGINLDIALAKNLDISTGVQIEYRDIETAVDNRPGMSAVQQTSYNMTNLDIPLNITWKFKNSRTESYYISGGFSSLAYLGENYSTTSYSQDLQSSIVYGTSGEENTVYKLVDVRTTTVERSEPFSSFDVAGRLNLMVGYSKSISPKLNLHLEPYLKIPLSGMGSKNMRFTTSGITCKISFR